MNIYKELELNTDKPAVLSIKKTDKSQMIAIGLGNGAVMKKHKTAVSTNLVVIKGSIKFLINDENLEFSTGEVYEIPVDIEHEVIGLESENIFIITKEL